MSENMIKYKGQYITYCQVASQLIRDYGCNSLNRLPTLLYLECGIVLCESAVGIISALYAHKCKEIDKILD